MWVICIFQSSVGKHLTVIVGGCVLAKAFFVSRLQLKTGYDPSSGSRHLRQAWGQLEPVHRDVCSEWFINVRKKKFHLWGKAVARPSRKPPACPAVRSLVCSKEEFASLLSETRGSGPCFHKDCGLRAVVEGQRFFMSGSQQPTPGTWLCLSSALVPTTPCLGNGTSGRGMLPALCRLIV